MLKMVKKAESSIQEDPKPKDRATWQRLRVLVEQEACHPDWASALYTLHRTGRIDNEQREAGDRYASLIRDYRKLWHDPIADIAVYRTPGYDSLEKRSPLTADVELLLGHVAADAAREESEFESKRAKRIGERYKEAKALAGPINSKLEDLLIEDIWPVGEVGHINIKFALTRLSHFFLTGTKHKRFRSSK